MSAPVAGVDGCKAGWVCVSQIPGQPHAMSIHPDFESLVAALPSETIIAVDMPIGLPECAGHGGRGPEQAARKHLGPRQSSVFSIPSRAAIYAESPQDLSWEEALAAHRRASAVARQTSDPPRGISIQAFFLFPKICELDDVLRQDSRLRERVHESHPELAFWRLNGGKAMSLPKKIRGRIHGSGMEERRCCLAKNGFDPAFLEAPAPRGAGADDFLDACAMAAIALRIASGEARPFPDPPQKDAEGLTMAIWA